VGLTAPIFYYLHLCRVVLLIICILTIIKWKIVQKKVNLRENWRNKMTNSQCHIREIYSGRGLNQEANSRSAGNAPVPSARHPLWDAKHPGYSFLSVWPLPFPWGIPLYRYMGVRHTGECLRHACVSFFGALFKHSFFNLLCYLVKSNEWTCVIL